MDDFTLPQMTLEEARQILKMEADWDWEKFRREAAKDILTGMVSHPRVFYGDMFVGEQVHFAIQYADELIKQLREEKK